MDSTRFFGSQVGSQDAINYSYTDMPWTLLAYDVYYFFTFAWATPYVLFPLRPCHSGDLDELAPTLRNVFCVFVHALLGLLQLAFVLALPLAVLFPVWVVALAVALFLLLNEGLCAFLNGSETTYRSDPEYATELPEHAHEQWIFVNGVAVGQHWMKNNLNRLAITFKRPILGIHNRTNGILLDIVECLVQRNLGYATADVRVCYGILKEKLYSPAYSKVVFILHSQGAIEGGMVLDWLLQELPQDLMCKLEVYTFGNAANHFNNPHRYVRAQTRALSHPALASVDAADLADEPPRINGGGVRVSSPERLPSEDNDDDTGTGPRNGGPLSRGGPRRRRRRSGAEARARALRRETSSADPASVSDRAVGHIEHYAHTTDLVALWGVLHFATSARAARVIPRFMGRVFARTSARGGHQFCQHYLDGMFPLVRDEATGGPARDAATGAFVGCAEGEGENGFMESEVLVGGPGDGMRDAEEVREELEFGWLKRRLKKENGSVPGEGPVKVHHDGGAGAVEEGTMMKVKDLSRLWQYRNGRSPSDVPPGLVSSKAEGTNGAVRIATF